MTSRTALLTGATGFLGSSLAVELLRADRERVYCVVRPRGDAASRLQTAVRAAADAAGIADVEQHLDRLVALAGDVSLPDLGLSDEDREALTADLPDEIWHAAASLQYEDKHKDEILRTNVDGTAHVVETAAELGVPVFNHISTAYVAGLKSGDVYEEPYDPTYAPNNWYEASKREGEDIVIKNAPRFERIRIMRPSVVIGNMNTYRSISESGWYGFLRGMERFCRIIERRHPGYLDANEVRLLVLPPASLNLVPIDVLVQEAVQLADDPTVDERYFHLTNPFSIPMKAARIGPESAIERLRIELVEDRALLNEFDAMLDNALDFYRPYMRNDKNFIRSRDAEDPPESMRISDEDLVAFSVVHLEDKRNASKAKAPGGSGA